MTRDMQEYFKASNNPRVTPIIVASAYAFNKKAPRDWGDTDQQRGARSVEPLCMIALALGVSLDAIQLRDWTIQTFGEPYVDGFTRVMHNPEAISHGIENARFRHGMEDGRKINQALSLIKAVINSLESMEPLAERLLNGDSGAIQAFTTKLEESTPLLEALEALDSGMLH